VSNALLAECYVYMYCNPLKGGLPFYIGKGTGNRMWDHLSNAKNDAPYDRNLHKKNTIKKILSEGLTPEIVVVRDCMLEFEAFELEEQLISTFGRSDNGTGILTNLTSGGEGTSGNTWSGGVHNPNYGRRGEDSIWWGKTHTEETKRKISEAQKGRVFSEEHVEAMRKPKSEEGRAAIAQARLDSTYRPSEETKQKVSRALKGRPSPNKGTIRSEETKAKQSLATKGVSKVKTTCIHCGLLCAPNTLHRWHMDNCKKKESL